MSTILKAHVSLNVTDIAASVAFYQKLFDVAPAKVRPGYAKFDLASPALNLSMVEKVPTGQNANHFGIQVGSTAEVLQERHRFERLGLLDQVEMGTVCCYAAQDKIWAMDPDGNRWEVFVVLEDAERMKDSEQGSCCVDAAPSSCATPATCVTDKAEAGACGCSQ